MPLIRRKIAKRPPHVGDPPPPPTSEKCSKKALYSDKIVYNLSGGGGGERLHLPLQLTPMRGGGGANYVSIITVEVNCSKDGNLHMHILF